MNVKPGMLAYVRCMDKKADNGKIVEVLRPAFTGDLYPNGDQLLNQSNLPAWWVRGVDLHSWGADGSCSGLTVACFYDYTLIPIRPDGITTEEVKELFSPSPAKESEKV